MSNLTDPVFQQLLGGIFGALALGTLVGQILKRGARTVTARETVANMNQRIMAWWVMCAVFGVAGLTGGIGSIVLFALVSFLALREFVTLVDSRRGDHRALLIAFFLVLVVQISDVLQYVFGKLFGRHKIAPRVSPNKTWRASSAAGRAPRSSAPPCTGRPRSSRWRRPRCRCSSRSQASSAASSWRRSRATAA